MGRSECECHFLDRGVYISLSLAVSSTWLIKQGTIIFLIESKRSAYLYTWSVCGFTAEEYNHVRALKFR